LAPQQTVLVRPYSDDTDDRMLAEIQPNFIVMFEPNMEFIRRIEVSQECKAVLNHDLDQSMNRYTRPRIPGSQ
jgi:DNA excision repair protein ERCC-4